MMKEEKSKSLLGQEGSREAAKPEAGRPETSRPETSRPAEARA
jgi:hypothetical protein